MAGILSLKYRFPLFLFKISIHSFCTLKNFKVLNNYNVKHVIRRKNCTQKIVEIKICHSKKDKIIISKSYFNTFFYSFFYYFFDKNYLNRKKTSSFEYTTKTYIQSLSIFQQQFSLQRDKHI